MLVDYGGVVVIVDDFGDVGLVLVEWVVCVEEFGWDEEYCDEVLGDEGCDVGYDYV